MRRYQIIACLVALVMLGAPAIERVHAYATFGVTWPTNQVQYYVNPANLYVSDAAALTALQGAASAWHDQSGANISLTYAGYTSVNALTLDYKNEVFFRNDTGGSVIAETYWYSSGTTLVDADIVFHEADHVFTTASYGCSGAQYYVENTGTHEFGHVLGMAHSPVTTATMYAYSDYCETIRETLDPDDIAGIQSLYPPAATPTVPSAPSQLSASVNASNPSSSLSLAWVDTATNATGYQVGRSTDGVTFTTIAQLGSTASTYVDTGLNAGASYSYRVAAFNSAGQSAFSNVATNTTQPPSTSPQTAPSAPFSPSPADGAAGVNPNVTLSWKDSGAQAYDVYLNGTLYAANLTSPSVAVSSLTSATAYSWTVTAKNSAGSTTGPAWSFTTSTPKKRGKR